MAETFLEQLAQAMCEAIESPERASAREEFLVHRPDDMTDEEWGDFVSELSRARVDLADAGSLLVRFYGI